MADAPNHLSDGSGRPDPIPRTRDEESRSFGLGRLLEDSLTAPLHPGAVFDALAPLPAPSYALMACAVAAATAAFLAINLAHAWMAYPAVLAYGPLWLAFGALWLEISGILLSFLGAGVLHIVSRLLGGAGSFSRSYQIVTVSSGLAAYQAILNWFPALWPLTFISAGIILALGLQKLHRTSLRPTWAAAAVLCALALSAVEVTLRAARPVLKGMQMAGETAQLLSQLPQTTAQPPDQPGAPGSTPSPAMSVIPMGDIPAPQGAPEGPSGPGPLAPAPPQSPAAAPSNQEMQAMLAGPMLMMNQMLTDPKMMKGVPPEKAKQLKEVIKILNELQASMRAGKPLTDEQTARMTAVMTQANRELMRSMPAMTPPPIKKEKKH